jgi:N-acetylglucosamine kinase-like BadF-type ATPase
LIGGTGSISLGRDPSGKTYRAGGWGHIIGDEGSGYELGRRALQAVSQMTDGRGPATTLRDAILARWEIETAWQMIDRVYLHSDKADIAALSSLVFAAAKEGDAVAQGFLSDAAADLAKTALAVANGLDFGGTPIPLALAGGLLTHEEVFRGMILDQIRFRQEVGQVEVVHDAALSAARAAIAAVSP